MNQQISKPANNQISKFLRIGALISGTGTNLEAVINACGSKKISGSVVFVGSDNFYAQGLKKAKKKGIPTFVVDYASILKKIGSNLKHPEIPNDFDLKDALSKQNIFPKSKDKEKAKLFLAKRAAAESLLIKKMEPYKFDLLILAGFMRNLSPYFIDKINTNHDLPRIMNIHPSLLPAFPGTDGYGDTFRYGCKIGGCTVHFIDYGEDSGPIIGQKAFEINGSDTLDTVKEKGLKLEWELYCECIQKFAKNAL